MEMAGPLNGTRGVLTKMSRDTEAASSDTRMELIASEWLLLLILSAVYFTHILDFIIVMPLGPQFEQAMEIGAREFGLLVAAYGFSAGVAGFLVAHLVDRFDRKKTLLALYGGFTLGTLGCALAPDYGFLLAARIVAGGFGGVGVACILAIVGDLFPDIRRGQAMGVVMTSFSVASCIGLPVGLWLAKLQTWRTPFAALALAGAIVFIAAWCCLPAVRGHIKEARRAPATVWQVLTVPEHLCAFALSISLVLASFLIGPFLPTYLVRNVKRPDSDLIWVYLAGGLATLWTMAWVGRLADRHGKRQVFAVLALATMVPFFIVTHLPPVSLPVVLMVTTVYWVLAAGRMVPATALITASSVPRYRGSFMSINSSVQQIAMGLATVVASLLLVDHKDHSLGGYGLLGWLACAMTAVSIALAYRLHGVVGGRAAARPETVMMTKPHDVRPEPAVSGIDG
jgi:predicted MFS family arabinose efflux permease